MNQLTEKHRTVNIASKKIWSQWTLPFSDDYSDYHDDDSTYKFEGKFKTDLNDLTIGLFALPGIKKGNHALRPFWSH